METCTMCWGEHEYDAPCAPVPAPPKPPALSMTFLARYDGRCSECALGIAEGEMVAYVGPDELAHWDCTSGPRPTRLKAVDG